MRCLAFALQSTESISTSCRRANRTGQNEPWSRYSSRTVPSGQQNSQRADVGGLVATDVYCSKRCLGEMVRPRGRS
jgi:hypothetical protein